VKPADPENPVHAFFRHVRERPEEPWLFFRPRLDWHWRSFRHLAVQVTATARRLAALLPQESGPRVALPRAGTPDEAPDAVVATLAILAVGGTAVPLGAVGAAEDWDAAPAAAHCEAQILPVGKGERASPRWPAVEVAAPPEMFSTEQPETRIPAERAASARVLSAQGEPWPISRWSAAVAAAYAPLGTSGTSGTSGRVKRGRDVVVLAGDLRSVDSRRLLTWATLQGAALLLEPDRRAGPAAIQWARATVIQATAPELEGLRHRAKPPKGWWKRRGSPFAPPLDRLRGIVVEGAEDLPEEAVNFWRRAGVEMLRLV
jgi:hypothetical protein